MLSHEWRELELLCQRISDLRHRYAAAIRTSNTGLIEGLKLELARTKRLRELVVHHISARLGTFAADPPHGTQLLDAGLAEHSDDARPAEEIAAGAGGLGSAPDFDRQERA
jgi:hypothetical protein